MRNVTGCCGGRTVAILLAILLLACVGVVAIVGWVRSSVEQAAAALPTLGIPALEAFPPGVTLEATTPLGVTPTPPSDLGRTPNGNPVVPGWGLWTPTPVPAPPAPTPRVDPRAVPPPGFTPGPPSPPGGVYPWPGNIPWYGPWLVKGKTVWWHGGWYPWPGHPGGGGWWPIPSPTRPPDALPLGVQPGYRCADGFYITRGEGNWQWSLGRYIVDGETIIDRLGGPANRPTVHTGCKPVP